MTLLQVMRPVARLPCDFCFAKPSLNTMPDAYTGYRYVRNKCLVSFVVRSLAPPPPDFNVGFAWLEENGFEVRNKRLLYVRAIVISKWNFNIEIGGGAGGCHDSWLHGGWAFIMKTPVPAQGVGSTITVVMFGRRWCWR